MIEVKNLYKSFQGKPILKDVSFSIGKSEIVCVVGASGSGKSTLLRCLNFLEKPDSGILKIDSLYLYFQHINRKQISELRQKSAMIFQEFNLFLNKNVLENVYMPLMFSRNKTENESKKIALKCLEDVGMSEFIAQYPTTLSGGQKQRVAIARSIAVQPNVLLFDEPTSALDPQWVEEILTIIEKLAQQQFTMIIVTHDILFAKRIADKVIFMDNGIIVEQGKTVLTNPQHELTKKFLQNVNKIS